MKNIYENRYPITTEHIIKNNFDKDKSYYIYHSMTQDLRLDSFNKINHLDIDLLVKGDLILINQTYLKTISKSIIILGDDITIKECHLLKSIPIEITSNKIIYFNNSQLYTTILSKEQFLSIKQFFVTGYSYEGEYFKQEISSYEEYSSLIENTLQKNNLLKICL